MRKLLPLIAIAFAAAAFVSSCEKDEQSTWDRYTDWRETNSAWLTQMSARKNPDGTPYFRRIVPEWNPGSFVLIHYFNDRAETEGNLTPLYTSTVDTRYYLRLYDGTPVDSSSANTTPAPGIYRTQVNSVIQGWAIALSDMRCGDTAEVVIPYGVAYGASDLGTIKPYSNLHFNIRLVDIPLYEASPY